MRKAKRSVKHAKKSTATNENLKMIQDKMSSLSKMISDKTAEFTKKVKSIETAAFKHAVTQILRALTKKTIGGLGALEKAEGRLERKYAKEAAKKSPRKNKRKTATKTKTIRRVKKPRKS